MDCSDCGKPIPEGEHCVVWKGTMVRFICIECSNKPEYKEINPLDDD